MLERKIETDFREKVEWLGCLCLKLSIIAWRGWPDRLVLGPNRLIIFFEFKRPGETARKNQSYIHRVLLKFGFAVYLVDDTQEALNIVIKTLKVEST